ncbi:MAG: hypothetical protein ACK5MR_17455 [Cumulibacter sp.]
MIGAMLTALLVGCGSTSAPGPSTPPSTPAISNEYAAVCTEVLNERDPEAFTAAEAALVDVLAAAVGGDTPSVSDLATWGEDLENGAAQFLAELENLHEVDDSAAWLEVVSPLQLRVERYQMFAELAGETWPLESYEYIAPPQPGDQYTAALAELDLAGRDCESLAAEPGPHPQQHDFVATAAMTCAVIVERRANLDYESFADVNIDLVVQVLEDEPIDVDDQATDALETLRAEWATTASVLEAIDASPPDPAAWNDAQQYAVQKEAVFATRVDALGSGDPAQISEAFAPGSGASAGWDWEPLGLSLRDCRSIQA